MTASSQPRPAPRARDAEATRADLLMAARRRFSALGYERTTSRDIAKDAGVNVSLIYRYFGSKEQLFEVVLEETADLFTSFQGQTVEQMIDGFVQSLTVANPHPYPAHKHPLVVLLRDTGDDSRTAALRHQTLGAVISHLAEQIAGNEVEHPTAEDVAAARVRAGLIFSMFAGLVSLREAIPQDPFARLAPEDLRRELGRIIAVVVGGRPPAP